MTDAQLVMRELARAGVELDRDASQCLTSLYRLVCAHERLPVSADAWRRPDEAAQRLFIRHWLEDRLARIAKPRTVPPFTEYQRPRAMQDALDRCPPRRSLITITGSR